MRKLVRVQPSPLLSYVKPIYMDVSAPPIGADILRLLSARQVWHYRVLPYKINDGQLFCYSDLDEQDAKQNLVEELEMICDKQIILSFLDADHLSGALSKYYRRPAPSRSASKSILKATQLEKIIAEAQSLEVSDIHFEPFKHHCRIRYRIDGALIEQYKIEKESYPGLVNQIKIKANLDISEKRLPQDGRIFFQQSQQSFDIRVSTLPSLHGEKIVLRLLSNQAQYLDLGELGFTEATLAAYIKAVKRPNGIVLISGPTGSGKTTSLYATLNILNEHNRNILTIEDPIEYTLEGITQVQLKEAIGLDFASALRTFLRQDPDIIMVGEIRDLATATMAIRASLTGHLVLSTLHTNSAWGIIARLIDMGVPAYLLADTLNVAVAQRLVRLLCPNCKSKQKISADTKDILPTKWMELDEAYQKQGCDECFFTGYRGRKAIYEVVPIDRELGHCIREKKLEVSEILHKKGIQSLADNALFLYAKGETSWEEIHAFIH